MAWTTASSSVNAPVPERATSATNRERTTLNIPNVFAFMAAKNTHHA